MFFVGQKVMSVARVQPPHVHQPGERQMGSRRPKKLTVARCRGVGNSAGVGARVLAAVDPVHRDLGRASEVDLRDPERDLGRVDRCVDVERRVRRGRERGDCWSARRAEEGDALAGSGGAPLTGGVAPAAYVLGSAMVASEVVAVPMVALFRQLGRALRCAQVGEGRNGERARARGERGTSARGRGRAGERGRTRRCASDERRLDGSVRILRQDRRKEHEERERDEHPRRRAVARRYNQTNFREIWQRAVTGFLGRAGAYNAEHSYSMDRPRSNSVASATTARRRVEPLRRAIFAKRAVVVYVGLAAAAVEEEGTADSDEAVRAATVPLGPFVATVEVGAAPLTVVVCAADWSVTTVDTAVEASSEIVRVPTAHCAAFRLRRKVRSSPRSEDF